MDLEKYRNVKRSIRTEKISVPQLAPFCEDGEDPVITVRGLSASELGKCREAASRQQDKIALASQLLGGNRDARADAIKQLCEGPEIPDDIAQRIEMLAIGCVDPKIEHSDSVLLSEDFPTEFYQLTNTILRLTGAGRQLGKP